mmetsp:Transcript_35594/g.82994  ORF Transcript_35594/g.82994 Transcript_35594/m.82994 type:complete len:287 (-) Transcript_35594:70-930(-)
MTSDVKHWSCTLTSTFSFMGLPLMPLYKTTGSMSTHSSTCSPSRITRFVPWCLYDRMRNKPFFVGILQSAMRKVVPSASSVSLHWSDDSPGSSGSLKPFVKKPLIVDADTTVAEPRLDPPWKRGSRLLPSGQAACPCPVNAPPAIFPGPECGPTCTPLPSKRTPLPLTGSASLITAGAPENANPPPPKCPLVPHPWVASAPKSSLPLAGATAAALTLATTPTIPTTSSHAALSDTATMLPLCPVWYGPRPRLVGHGGVLEFSVANSPSSQNPMDGLHLSPAKRYHN